MVVEDSDNALIDNVVITGEQQPRRGVEFRVRADERFGGLRIRNVVAPRVREVGIALEDLSSSGRLDSYIVRGNMATVKAELPATRRAVEGNL